MGRNTEFKHTTPTTFASAEFSSSRDHPRSSCNAAARISTFSAISSVVQVLPVEASTNGGRTDALLHLPSSTKSPTVTLAGI